MKIFEYTKGFTPPMGKCVLALGLFDGMHVAHRDLLSCGRQVAEEMGLPFGIFTFANEGGIKSSAPKIYDTRQKLVLAERAGAEFAIIASFESLSGMTPEDFVRDTLVRDCGTEVAVAGFNFRFGKGAAGDAQTLVQLMESEGKHGIIREEIKLGGATVSSSIIRTFISLGNMHEVKKLLGAPYSVTGTVCHGDGRGKELGLPTVNTDIPVGRVLPANGVYRSAVPIDGRIYNAVTNIGTCPTFGERRVHAETYILDFDGDLYDREIEVFLLAFLRKERKFKSQSDLILQIKLDISSTNTKNGDITWQELGLS